MVMYVLVEQSGSNFTGCQNIERASMSWQETLVSTSWITQSHNPEYYNFES